MRSKDGILQVENPKDVTITHEHRGSHHIRHGRRRLLRLTEAAAHYSRERCSEKS